ncbi:hypothetical protein K0M31_016688 [Melipona bicolor]|uniref:Uncharacterized protein n=1 Tax=Melipona bicolor TaxID=60889 RepID=A0AA40FED3_9HYME|nr:hypothetical protein K0M31_016688 [Melipona bicolor]
MARANDYRRQGVTSSKIPHLFQPLNLPMVIRARPNRLWASVYGQRSTIPLSPISSHTSPDSKDSTGDRKETATESQNEKRRWEEGTRTGCLGGLWTTAAVIRIDGFPRFLNGRLLATSRTGDNEARQTDKLYHGRIRRCTGRRYQFYKEETLRGEDATGKPMSRERFETPLYTLNKEHTVKNNLLAIGGNNSNKRKNNDNVSTLPSISNSRQEKRKKKRREDEKWYKPRRDEERLAKTQKEGCINRDAKEERKKENGRPSPEAFSREGRQRVSRELKVSWTKPRDKTRELIWCLPVNGRSL